MAVAAAATATTPAAADTAGGGLVGAATRGKGGKLFVKFGGSALRTLRSAPVGGTNQDFVVPPAFFAMKFVNRHGGNVAASPKILKSGGSPAPVVRWWRSGGGGEGDGRSVRAFKNALVGGIKNRRRKIRRRVKMPR
jgi:hypothetical protein